MDRLRELASFWLTAGRHCLRRRSSPRATQGLPPGMEPVSRLFGLDRGQPIDRYYIERFLSSHKDAIKGRVLEIGDRYYTRKFGKQNVTVSDVLHAEQGNSKANIVGDLATGQGIPVSDYECVILTQTLPFIYDIRNAVKHVYLAMADRSVLLATLPCISQISRYDMNRWGDFWRFTDASARKLFEEVFGPDDIVIEIFGNVITACALLQGLASEELEPWQLDFTDEDYQVLIGVRAMKNR